MAAEKLRDLSQPIDVALLDATVAAFYGTGSKEEFPWKCGRGEGIVVFPNLIKSCRFGSGFGVDFLASQTGGLVFGEFCDLYFGWICLDFLAVLPLLQNPLFGCQESRGQGKRWEI
ncbi:Protein EXPORTIN 1B [Vitis vinifera]|uniref:Protein EXPORTIN 1B n=1 Tax=Vitis vinifera TaxID=29760 RepID=A0A438IY93_VITVI|nr:Protein EXPORTIN 1B [Vitis vinifera]